MIAHRSRFELDLNRPRDRAVYMRPEDAWGIRVWKSKPPAELVERSLAVYDAFYRAAELLLADKVRQHRQFVVYDLHSYNHRRAGPAAAPADPATHPEVNVGTGSMDRVLWAPVVDRLIADLRSTGFEVGENVKFLGGELAAWVHRRFPFAGCAIAIEFKKLFMDEWTGEPRPERVDAIERALHHAARGTLEVLSSLPRAIA
jgi:N-formylglutamate amidohydrolase